MAAPIETLMTEHRLIEKVLDSLEAFAGGLGADAANRTRIGDYVTFLRTFADKCHHGKEEDLLFQEMIAHGMPAGSGPIGMMLEEHTMGRALVGKLAAVAEGDGDLTEDERSTARYAAGDFCQLLRAHIQKEDGILYPIAGNVLPADVMAGLEDRFEAFEREQMGEGIHERMHALAESLVGSAQT